MHPTLDPYGKTREHITKRVRLMRLFEWSGEFTCSFLALRSQKPRYIVLGLQPVWKTTNSYKTYDAVHTRTTILMYQSSHDATAPFPLLSIIEGLTR